MEHISHLIQVQFIVGNILVFYLDVCHLRWHHNPCDHNIPPFGIVDGHFLSFLKQPSFSDILPIQG